MDQAAPPETGASDEPWVTFAASGVRVPWTGSADSLLELAEAAGLRPDFSCRAGICSTCKCDLLAGEVKYFEEPLDPPGPGEVLLCCSKPLGSVTIGA